MTDSNERTRLARLQEIRTGMEVLHADALAERGGKTFTSEESVEASRMRS